MELSPTRETTDCVATRELPSVLWIPKVYCRIHKSTYSYSEPDQSNQYSFHPHPICPRCILYYPPTHVLVLLVAFPSGFPTINVYAVLFPAIRATCPPIWILNCKICIDIRFEVLTAVFASEICSHVVQ
jgi:hypothetical protein